MKDSRGSYSPEYAKTLGAFYTDNQIADFLVWWAIRLPTDAVMDPSFGGGVFLRSASSRLRDLGGDPSAQVFGVEIDAEVLSPVAEQLGDEFGVRRENLLQTDFFDLDPSAAPPVDVVVGNPPFIRYQRFAGKSRDKAIRRAREQRVNLSKLSSSWAPFVVHATSLIRPGGRLAMVLPMEIGHAAYARPVLEHLRLSFGQVTFLTFRRRLFPDLNEDTLLVLADDKGVAPARFYVRDMANSGMLRKTQVRDRRSIGGIQRLDAQAISQGRERLVNYLLPRKTRELYKELKASEKTASLGQLADVGIGYVTGANEFFHISPREALDWAIPDEYLTRAVRRGRSLTGVRFTDQDWSDGLSAGETGYLLRIENGAPLPSSVQKYIAFGEKKGYSDTYKCRTRSPWYSVPHVHEADAFLTYMSGHSPQFVVNDAGAVAPNSLHIVRVRPDAAIDGEVLAGLWVNSLTSLSAEIEGHSLGGGMLKLEPTEAENVLMVIPALHTENNRALAGQLDELIRDGKSEQAIELGDEIILKGMFGLERHDIAVLSEAVSLLRGRRRIRGSN